MDLNDDDNVSMGVGDKNRGRDEDMDSGKKIMVKTIDFKK